MTAVGTLILSSWQLSSWPKGQNPYQLTALSQALSFHSKSNIYSVGVTLLLYIIVITVYKANYNKSSTHGQILLLWTEHRHTRYILKFIFLFFEDWRTGRKCWCGCKMDDPGFFRFLSRVKEVLCIPYWSRFPFCPGLKYPPYTTHRWASLPSHEWSLDCEILTTSLLSP